MVHCKEVSGYINKLINLNSDLGFQCQTRTKLITLDELDQKMFFAFLVILANGERSPPYKYCHYELQALFVCRFKKELRWF